jgi:heme-degrading monooxygenase HmoA
MIRFAKVRTTDHRPASSGLEQLERIQAREAAEHDKAVADYSPQLLQSAWEDLNARHAWDRKDPEHRWIMARRAALMRAGQRIVKGGRA